MYKATASLSRLESAANFKSLDMFNYLEENSSFPFIIFYILWVNQFQFFSNLDCYYIMFWNERAVVTATWLTELSKWHINFVNNIKRANINSLLKITIKCGAIPNLTENIYDLPYMRKLFNNYIVVRSVSRHKGKF